MDNDTSREKTNDNELDIKKTPDSAAEAGDESTPKTEVAEAESERKFLEKEAAIKYNSVGCLPTISYVFFILGCSILIAALLILAANDMFALVKTEKTIEITIEAEDTIRDISDLLGESGIIRYPSLFRSFAKLTKMDEKINPGQYTLKSSMDYRTILSTIGRKQATREVVTVTIPEGMEQRDIFELLEEKGVCEAWKLQSYAKYYDFGYSFIAEMPYSETRLEGYLFPDTYEFYKDELPNRVLNKFLVNYNRKWSVDMKARLENINISQRDILIIASMIEKEARFDDERPLVASVIHNRLKNSQFPYLQIDATVQYALPSRKDKLTNEDLLIDSPYNTYKYPGLPVGPICNPGLAAIRAALYPDETPYYYYVARGSGWHYFAETLEQHEANIELVNNEKDTDEEPNTENTLNYD